MKKVDEFLSRLIENDILNKAKTDPQVLQQLSQAFLNKEWIDILNKYIDFISQTLKIETEVLDQMIKDGEDIELQLERIRAYKGRMAIVWEAYQTIEESNWTAEVNDLLDKIKISFTDQKKTEAEVTKTLVSSAKEKMDGTTADSEDFRKTAEDSVKVAYIISDFSNKDEDKKKPEPAVIDVEWEEVRDEMEKDVEDFRKSTDDFNKRTEGKAESITKRDVIIRNAIEELRNWGDLNTLESQFVNKSGTVAIVYDIIIDDSHPLATNSSLIGAIKFRKKNNIITDVSQLPIAYPFDKNFKNIPIALGLRNSGTLTPKQT